MSQGRAEIGPFFQIELLKTGCKNLYFKGSGRDRAPFVPTPSGSLSSEVRAKNGDAARRETRSGHPSFIVGSCAGRIIIWRQLRGHPSPARTKKGGAPQAGTGRDGAERDRTLGTYIVMLHIPVSVKKHSSGEEDAWKY